jgi:hypothetical protein
VKILILDIETTPHLCWSWGLWNQNIAPNQIEEPSRVLCFAAKWYGKRDIIFDRSVDMLDHLHTMLSEADAVVHYNGSKFDIPRINTEFAKLGWEQPDPFKQIDMIKVVKKHFGFPSNRLDYVCQELGLGRKVETNNKMKLWLDCMDDDPAAWRTMKRYNVQDVKILEKLYDELKGWIHNHPNFGHYVDDSNGVPVCTNCGSRSVIRKGIETTRARVYRRYRCNDCSNPMRGATSLVRGDDGEWTERETDRKELR